MAADQYVQEVAIALLKEHIPSLSNADEGVINERVAHVAASLFLSDPDDREGDVADLALRTCACGKTIDGFYEYVDHLITVFGGESHYGG